MKESYGFARIQSKGPENMFRLNAPQERCREGPQIQVGQTHVILLVVANVLWFLYQEWVLPHVAWHGDYRNRER